MRPWRFAILMLMMLLSMMPVMAEGEDDETAPPLPVQEVETRAVDGLRLRADFYLVDPARPTIFLLHELYTTRESWQPVIPALVENGYNVLAVDVRGWGRTRGDINWTRAVDDVQTWFDWLRTEGGVRADGISTMGSSMGSTLAIVGCATDDLCRTALAISPGMNYYRISVADSLTSKPILVVYAERDRWPALGVPDMVEAASDTISVYTYTGNAHGVDMLNNEIETFIPIMLEWFAAHNG